MGVPGGGKVIFVTIVNTRPNVVGPLQQTKFISKTKLKNKLKKCPSFKMRKQLRCLIYFIIIGNN